MSLRTTTALFLGAAVAGAALGHTRGLRSGMAIGYAYGDRDGMRRGDANARLDMVLATDSVAKHYEGVVSQLPDAYDSAAFWEAIRNDGLHERVSEETS